MKKLIIISIFSLFIFSCSDKLIEEVKETYDNGEPKVVEFYSESGGNKKLIKTLEYDLNHQLISENSHLTGKFIGYSYYKNGQIRSIMDGNPDEGFLKLSFFYNNGPLQFYGKIIDSSRHGKWTFYNKDKTLDREHFYNNGEEISKEEWELIENKEY